MYQPGSIYYQQFNTNNISGVSTNTDSTPWGTLVKNGVDDFTSKVFVTNVDAGRYTVSGTIPLTYTFGNYVNLAISGQVNGLLSKTTIALGVLDAPVNTLSTSVTVTGVLAGVTISVTGVVNANVVTVSGIPIAAPGTSGALITDSRYVNGVPVLSYDGFAQGGTINTIILGSNEPQIDHYYDWASIIIGGGSGLNQMAMIVAYSGASQTAYLDRNWKVTPSAGTPYTFFGYNVVNPKYLDGVAITGGMIATNFASFFRNAGNLTSKIVDNISTTSGTVQANIVSISPGVLVNLTSSGVDNVMLENGVNLRQGNSIMTSVLGGVSSGNGNVIWYQAINNPGQNRLSSNANSGIRSSVNYTIPT
jgi:hypothetical protein